MEAATPRLCVRCIVCLFGSLRHRSAHPFLWGNPTVCVRRGLWTWTVDVRRVGAVWSGRNEKPVFLRVFVLNRMRFFPLGKIRRPTCVLCKGNNPPNLALGRLRHFFCGNESTPSVFPPSSSEPQFSPQIKSAQSPTPVARRRLIPDRLTPPLSGWYHVQGPEVTGALPVGQVKVCRPPLPSPYHERNQGTATVPSKLGIFPLARFLFIPKTLLTYWHSKGGGGGYPDPAPIGAGSGSGFFFGDGSFDHSGPEAFAVPGRLPLNGPQRPWRAQWFPAWMYPLAL